MPSTPGPTTTPQEWSSRLASLIATIRTDWDEHGIAAVIRKISDRPLAEVAHAALTAAITRTDQRTPAVIALDGKHWRLHGVERPAPPAPSSVIVTRCGHNLVGALCAECHPVERRGVSMPDDVRAKIRESVAAGKAAVAALDQNPPPPAHNQTETDAHA